MKRIDPADYSAWYENLHSPDGGHCGHDECDTTCEFIYTATELEAAA
ncbi:hypothetical protein ACWIGI_28675 [Nocardia sp. NPDC055321]